MEKVVDLKGWVSSEALGRIYNEADALILPTYSEGFPNVVLEAMYYGLPVITTAVGNIPDVVQDQRNGYLVPPGNAGALAGAMKKTLGLSEEDFHRISSVNHKQVMADHDAGTLGEKMYSLLFSE